MCLFTQDVLIEGKSANVLTSRHTGTTYSATAIKATVSSPNCVGIEGLGGRGVYGYCGTTTGGVHFGVDGQATGGTSANYGVHGYASGANAYAGFFNGNVYSTGGYVPSDMALKTNISDFREGLSKVMRLKPKTYEYDSQKGLPEGKRMGFIAQDLESVLPQCVKDVVSPVIGSDGLSIKDSAGNDKTETYKAINYTDLISVIISSVQEQQKEIDELKRLIKK
jgi:hypothetical protein